MNNEEDVYPTTPTRFKTFAAFFKNYMSVSSVVVALLPIPVTSWNLIPTYASQTKLLSVYTPLFCFLTLGFIFYSRHIIARLMFPYALGLSRSEAAGGAEFYHWLKRLPIKSARVLINLLPLLLILLAFFSMYCYNKVLIDTINYRQVNAARGGFSDNTESILKETTIDDIHCDDDAGRASRGESSYVPVNPGSNEMIFFPSNDQSASTLMFLYIALFVLAEAAFILMAIREYLQDLLKFSELDLIIGPRKMDDGIAELAAKPDGIRTRDSLADSDE